MATQHYFLHSALLIFSLSIIGPMCSAVDKRPTAARMTPAIPSDKPSIVGLVTRIALPMISVEENPVHTQGSAKANVRIKTETQLILQGRGVVGSGELRVGQKVRVWFAGPVMESYPAQASAAVIVIESNVPLK